MTFFSILWYGFHAALASFMLYEMSSLIASFFASCSISVVLKFFCGLFKNSRCLKCLLFASFFSSRRMYFFLQVLPYFPADSLHRFFWVTTTFAMRLYFSAMGTSVTFRLAALNCRLHVSI